MEELENNNEENLNDPLLSKKEYFEKLFKDSYNIKVDFSEEWNDERFYGLVSEYSIKQLEKLLDEENLDDDKRKKIELQIKESKGRKIKIDNSIEYFKKVKNNIDEGNGLIVLEDFIEKFIQLEFYNYMLEGKIDNFSNFYINEMYGVLESGFGINIDKLKNERNIFIGTDNIQLKFSMINFLLRDILNVGGKVEEIEKFLNDKKNELRNKDFRKEI